MKITSVEHFSYYYVETDQEEWGTFRRNDKGSWEQLMGQSWEDVWKTDELDALFEAYSFEKFQIRLTASQFTR
jgi:hypothetical protein